MRAKERAAVEWLRHQEDAGIDWEKKTPMGIRDNRYTVDVPTVTGPLSSPQPVHLEEAQFTRAQTDRRLKFTLPGSMTICDTIANAHYATRADMTMAFADILNTEARKLEAAGIDLIQFDEPAFNVFMEDVKEWGIDALHRAIEGLSCLTAVHICYEYGIEENLRWKDTLGSEWRQYEEIFPALNDSRIDQVSLERADSRVPLAKIQSLAAGANLVRKTL